MLVREGYYIDGWKYNIYKKGNGYLLINERKLKTLKFRRLRACQRYIELKNDRIIAELYQPLHSPDGYISRSE